MVVHHTLMDIKKAAKAGQMVGLLPCISYLWANQRTYLRGRALGTVQSNGQGSRQDKTIHLQVLRYENTTTSSQLAITNAKVE